MTKGRLTIMHPEQCVVMGTGRTEVACRFDVIYATSVGFTDRFSQLTLIEFINYKVSESIAVVIRDGKKRMLASRSSWLADKSRERHSSAAPRHFRSRTDINRTDGSLTLKTLEGLVPCCRRRDNNFFIRRCVAAP